MRPLKFLLTLATAAISFAGILYILQLNRRRFDKDLLEQFFDFQDGIDLNSDVDSPSCA